jgi:hypothetical protein
MRILNQFRITTLALACAALASATSAEAAVLNGHGADTFALAPSSTPGVVTDTVDGVAQLSLLGNCSFHAEQSITLPATPDQPYIIKGVWRFTSADGATTLDAETEGTGLPDPANAGFVNIHLKVKFTGGTGQMANARGKGKIDGVGMFTSAAGGTATWSLKGLVLAREVKDSEGKDLK